MKQTYFSLVLFCFSLFFGINCAFSESEEMVFVSILPQKFFVQQISGDSLAVEVMVLPGASPATYEPKSSQMRKLANSSAYFAIGVPFENAWLDKISGINPAMKIIHTDLGINKIAMEKHFHEEDHHSSEMADGDSEEHNHQQTGLDPHIWLSPVLVKTQAETIYNNLKELFPDKSPLFTTNYRAFLDTLDRLHKEIQNQLSDIKGKRFMVFHPSWGYFAKEYGLEQIAIEIEGKSPKPSQMKEIIEHAKELNINVIFAQSQFSVKSATIIAGEISGEVILVDPLAENYFANMKDVAAQLKKAAK
jgi:zinc transport system substrate-binding protein